MSGSSRDAVSTITGSERVRSSALRRRSTSSPPTLGRSKSSRITLGAIPISCHGCEPSPKKKSSASAPSRATNTWFVRDRKSTRLNSSHGYISYAVFCLKKKKKTKKKKQERIDKKNNMKQ